MYPQGKNPNQLLVGPHKFVQELEGCTKVVAGQVQWLLLGHMDICGDHRRPEAERLSFARKAHGTSKPS